MEVKDAITTLWSKVNDMATIVKVIMIAIGKIPQRGGASEHKGEAKIFELNPYVRERDA